MRILMVMLMVVGSDYSSDGLELKDSFIYVHMHCNWEQQQQQQYLVEKSGKIKMSSRIFARRYFLNSSRSLWLEVGIAILPVPHVEIELIDKKGKEFPVTEEDFLKLHDQRLCVLRYLFNNNPSTTSEILHFGTMDLKFSKAEEQSCIILSVADSDIIILRNTYGKLLRLHDTAESRIVRLKSSILPQLQNRLSVFVGIVKELDNRYEAHEAIRSSSKFNRTAELESELVTLGLAEIIKMAQPEMSLEIESHMTQ